MSKQRSKKESKAAQRAANKARTQVQGKDGAAKPAKTPTRAKRATVSAPPKPKGPVRELTFGRQTYLFMGIGFALVLLGLLLMAGDRGENYAEFDVDYIYSFRRITLAPIVILGGLGVVIYGIFKK